MPKMDPTVTLHSLKGEARQLVEQSRSTETPITHAQALETVARRHGFANWNACSAYHASKPARPRVPLHVEDFEELDDPDFWFSADQLGGGLSRSVGDLETWARRLELLADSTDQSAWNQMIGLMGERKPYMFERNTNRWPDGRFYLVDRGYTPFKHVAFTEDELKQFGLDEWTKSKYCWSGVDDDIYVVMDDEFGDNADPVGLKWLARMLLAVAKKVYEREHEPVCST